MLAMHALADRLGWSLRPVPSLAVIRGRHRLELFTTGRDHKVRNHLSGLRGEYAIAVFDLTYVTGGFRHTHVWKQTVVHVRSPSLHLPGFTLRPESLLDKIAGVLGYQDIDLDDDAEFSFLYLLRGRDTATIRLLMGEDARRFFRDNPGSCSEGWGNDLFFWIPTGMLPVDALEAQVGRAIHLARCLGTGPAPARLPRVR